MIKGGNVNRLERVWSKGKDGDDESHFSLKVISFKTTGRMRAISGKTRQTSYNQWKLTKAVGKMGE